MVRALLLLALLSSVAFGDLRVATPRVLLDVRGGAPARLENRLTGEFLELAPPTDAPAVQLAKDWIGRNQAEQADDTSFSVAGKASCRTEFTASADGSVVLAQQAETSSPGLRSVAWGLAGIPSQEVQVIVPGYSGTAFGGNREAPFRDLGFSWPASWEAGFVLLQMERGGFLVWANDPEWRFKTLRLSNRRGRFGLRFESEAIPPFDAVTRLDSVPWHIEAYAGDWRVGAGIYREWLRQRLRPPALAERKPTWVGGITAMVICGMDHETIRELAKHAVPGRTILYVPGWRRDGYDMNYPDYTPVPEFAPFVAEAHRLGFRVMAHVNYFGCDPKHPLYETYGPYQLRTAGTDAPQWWTWPRKRKPGEEPRIKFAYIHPGLAAWRRELVERFAKLVAETGVDSLHLDQTLHIVNHNRGKVDGMTVPEGNLALHRELREALPEVALSGEGLDEVTFLHEAFAQRHAPHAVSHTEKTWDERFIRCAHPICSYLFAPHTTINGYLGMSNPNAGPLWDAWMRSYELWGSIPTFARPSLRQLRQPGSREALALRQLGLWTRHALLPDFDHAETTDTRLLWRGTDATAAVEHSPAGLSHVRLRTERGEETLYEYATGVRSFATGGGIPGWPAYQDRSLLGLLPRQTYLVLPDAPRTSGPRLTALPGTLGIARARSTPSFLEVELVDADGGLVLDLAAAIDQAQVELVGDGIAAPAGDGGSFDPTSLSDGETMRPGIFAHPPWKQRLAGAATTFDTVRGRYRLRLPADCPAVLSVGLALRGQAEEKSDGVTFRVLANGKAILDRHWGKAAWDRHELSLADYQGQEIQLDLCTSPGPAGNVEFDWAVWGNPVIRALSEPRRQAVELASPVPVVAMLDREGEVPLEILPAADGQFAYRCRPLLPGTLVACLKEAPDVALPIDLTTHPMQVSIVDEQGGAIQGAPSFVAIRPGKGTSGNVERPGMNAHPPSSGRTIADYLLRLPADAPARLRFSVGLRDGSQSSGCLFVAAANGTPLWQQVVSGADGWHEAEVDLSSFAGKPLVLSLAVDPAGPYDYDWGFWAEPRLVAAPR